MGKLDTVTESDLRRFLTPEAFRAAEALLDFVLEPRRNGDRLEASVADGPVYRVAVEVVGNALQTGCSCQQRGGCNHPYAALLLWLRSPDEYVDEDEAPEADLGTDEEEALAPVTLPPQGLPSWMDQTQAGRQQAALDALARALQSYRLQDLRQLAADRGWQVRGNSKDVVAGRVAEAMAQPEGVLRAAMGLPEGQRRALAAMVWVGPEPANQISKAATLAAYWGSPADLAKHAAHTHELCRALLALRGDALGSYPVMADLVPDVVARALLPLVYEAFASRLEGPRANAGQPAAEAACETHLADPYALADVANRIVALLERVPTALRPRQPRPEAKTHTELGTWDYDPAEVQRLFGPSGRPASWDATLTVPPPAPALDEAAHERLAPVAGDVERLEFVYALLVQAGLVVPGESIGVRSEVKVQFLRRTPLAQRAILARAYRSLTKWSELWALLGPAPGEPAAVGGGLELRRQLRMSHFSPDYLDIDLGRFRTKALRALACLPEGQWVPLADFERVERIAWPRFDQATMQPGYYGDDRGIWYLTRTGGQRLADKKPEDWDLAQGRFLRALIMGPLHWLGLADYRLERGELAAVRLHGLADLFWDRCEVPAAPLHAQGRTEAAGVEPGAVKAEGMAVSASPLALSGEAHNLLDRIAKLEVGTAELFTYRLDAAAAYRAFEAGATLAQVMGDWQRLLPVPMPEAMRNQLAAWWGAYGQVRLYEELAVIEFADDYTLAELRAATSLGEHIVAEVSPRLVIIKREDAAALFAELKKAGYTPRQTERV